MLKRNISLERKRSLTGYLFLIPWLLGIVLFFSYPLVMTVVYSFSHFNIHDLTMTPVGFENYSDAFTKDAEFPVLLVNSLLDSLKTVPLIFVFSFFIALLLRKDFKGSFLIKGIFFLTVILSSDAFLRLQVDAAALRDAPMQGVANEASGIFSTLDALSLDKYLVDLGINSKIIDYITAAVQDISDITIRSGIQIFIFLAGLKSIPDSMYEAATIEGATAWESLWEITLPLMTPIILVNLIYSIIDSFGTLTNPLLSYISKTAFTSFSFSYAAALSIIYFAIILTLLALVALFMRKRISYQG